MKFGTFLNFCDLNSIAISDNNWKPQSLDYKQKKVELELVVGLGVGSCSTSIRIQYSGVQIDLQSTIQV